MPLKRCQIEGKDGWKWGDEGKCFTGPDGKRKAIAQAIAIISKNPKDINEFAANIISVDYDNTASTKKGKELLKRLISEGKTVYIISARSSKLPIVSDLKDLIPSEKIFATGSNSNKVKKAKDLGVDTHYDNKQSVVDEMNTAGIKGILFK